MPATTGFSARVSSVSDAEIVNVLDAADTLRFRIVATAGLALRPLSTAGQLTPSPVARRSQKLSASLCAYSGKRLGMFTALSAS